MLPVHTTTSSYVYDTSSATFQVSMAAPAAPPVELPLVTSLADAFRWVEHNLAVLCRIQGSACLDRIASSLNRTTISTAFSGTGGAENACDAIQKGLLHFMPTDDINLTSLWACDFLRESQLELQMLPHSPECVFADMTDFVEPGLRADLKTQVPRMRYDDLLALFGNADKARRMVVDRAFCVKHQKICLSGRASLHIAGTPCIAWSSFGSRCGASGMTALCFFTWVAQRLVMEEDAILHENVPEFEPALLERVFGSRYVVSSCLLNSSEFGQLSERPRRFTWLINKKVVMSGIRMPQELAWDTAYTTLFRRSLRVTCAQLLTLGSDEEIEGEWRWAARRVTSKAHGTFHAWLDLDGGEERLDFSQVLTATESVHLADYMNLLGSAGTAADNPDGCAVCSLTQNPANRPCHNKGRRTLSTVIKNNFPQYVPSAKRWLTPLETLASNTHVSYPALSQFGETTSFCYNRADYGFPPRARHHMFNQAGDGMSLPSVGLALLWYHSQNMIVESILPHSFLGTLSRALCRQSSNTSGSPTTGNRHKRKHADR
jgi:site-specific DNA-cytosine methylase